MKLRALYHVLRFYNSIMSDSLNLSSCSVLIDSIYCTRIETLTLYLLEDIDHGI